MTDPIADLLIRIKNAGQRGHESVTVPASKLRAEILRVLKAEGFISHYEKEKEEAETHPIFRIRLRYVGPGQPVIAGMRRISKPGRRVYAGKDEIPQVLGGLGITILSTSQGVMTGKSAIQHGIGGEVLCEVY